MFPIKTKVYLAIKSLVMGILIILFLISKGNIERLILFFATLILISILKGLKFNTFHISTCIVSIIIGTILGNIMVFYYTNTLAPTIKEEYTVEKENYNKSAVILIGKGESPVYDYHEILKKLYKQNKAIDFWKAPIEAFKHKLAYEDLGKSKYNDLCKEIENKLQGRLGEEYKVYSTFLSIRPRFSNEISRISKNYNKIILVPLFLVESDNYKQLTSEVKKGLVNTQTVVRITPLFWKSEKLAKQIAIKVIESGEVTNKNLAGMIILKDNKNTNFKQENTFASKIIKYMGKYDFNIDKTVYFKYSDLSVMDKAVHKLQEEGVNQLIIISYSSLIDDIKKQWDINKITKKLSKKEKIKIRYIKGWGIGENLLNELELKIRLANLKYDKYDFFNSK